MLVGLGVGLLAAAAWSVTRAGNGDVASRARGVPFETDAVRNNALLVLVGAFVAVVVVLVARNVRWNRPGMPSEEDEEQQPTPWWLRVLVVGAFPLALMVLVWVMSSSDLDEVIEPPPAAPPTTEQVQTAPQERPGARGWGAAGLVAAGAVAATAATLVWQRRSRGRGVLREIDALALAPPAEPRDLEALAPVDAVRAAYAAAKVALIALGVAPRAAEAPYEYLVRAREGAPSVARAMATLTTLFEIARFSHHTVTDAMKTDALAAYGAIVAECADPVHRAEAT